MKRIDTRSLPENNWTFYVVGDLPTMEDFYRVDTVQEAIDLYHTMPTYLRSAIGASINGTNEYDLIHRREGNTPVLVMDFASDPADPVWSSPEIQDKIDCLIALLGVHHQYDSKIFRGYPSIIAELDRFQDNNLDPYFKDKRLQPESVETGPNKYISAIHEVYVRGEGWMDRDKFLSHLHNSRPSAPGKAAKDVFVDRLNVEYKKEHSYTGQIDISPHEFHLLLAKTERELHAEGKGTPFHNPSPTSLDQKIYNAQNTLYTENSTEVCPRSPER